MALNLTNEYIAVTFQRLLQIDPNEAAAGFKPFSLSNAINSDSATLINGVGEKINGVVIEQFDQAGLFLKNTNTTFQIYSSTHNSKNGIKFKQYTFSDNVFVTDEGHLYVNYGGSYDTSSYSLYVDRGIHLNPISGAAYLKGNAELDVRCQNIRARTFETLDREIDSGGSGGITNLGVEPGVYEYSASYTIGNQPNQITIPAGYFGVSDYVGGRFGPLKLDLPQSLVAGDKLRLRMRQYGPQPSPYANADNIGSILELVLNPNQTPDYFEYTITLQNVNDPNTLVQEFAAGLYFQIQGDNLIFGFDPFNNQMIVSVNYPYYQDLEYSAIFPINPTNLSSTTEHIYDTTNYLGNNDNGRFRFLWQHVSSQTQNTQNNSSNYDQLIVVPDKDILDSGSYKRIIQGTNTIVYFVNWRRVGNVIHCTGFRSWIPNTVINEDAIELLPVVTQSHVDDGTPVYTYLYGNGVLRDGTTGSAPVPIICKANDDNGTIASANCAVQFFKYDDLSTPIKDFGNGDIRFSFSYDLKN